VTIKPDKAGEVLHHYAQGVVRMEVVEDGRR
jgi:hypothetical protein